jgi:hypothetical protein
MVTALAITTHQRRTGTPRAGASRRGRQVFTHAAAGWNSSTQHLRQIRTLPLRYLVGRDRRGKRPGLALCNEVERSLVGTHSRRGAVTNVLQPPDEARMELMVAMSHDRQLAADTT